MHHKAACRAGVRDPMPDCLGSDARAAGREIRSLSPTGLLSTTTPRCLQTHKNDTEREADRAGGRLWWLKG